MYSNCSYFSPIEALIFAWARWDNLPLSFSIAPFSFLGFRLRYSFSLTSWETYGDS